MVIKKILNIETFVCKLEFTITDNINKEVSKIYKKYNYISNDNDEVEGIVITGYNDVYHLLIDSKYLTHNTIAHEIYHTTVRITEDRDVTDEETQAWLCGYITDAVYKFIDLKKIEIKKNGK